MKYIHLQIIHSEESLHPMHEFEINHSEFHGSELLHWNPAIGETNSMIFRVEGDPNVYKKKLDKRGEVVDYSISSVEKGRFYCCVCERLTDRDRAYVQAFAQGTLVVIPPVHYNQDSTIDVTLVGSPSDVDTVLTEFPKESEVDVLSVGEYATRAPGATSGITSRQREVVNAAVECGYYQSPRSGTVSEIASKLNISPSTAAEHLRKAEAKLMPKLLNHE